MEENTESLEAEKSEVDKIILNIVSMCNKHCRIVLDVNLVHADNKTGIEVAVVGFTIVE